MDKPLNSSLMIPLEIVSTMLAIVASAYPREACGLISGIGQTTDAIYPITNIAPDSSTFFMHPDELLAALMRIDRAGSVVTGIFHSHPQGRAYPTESDLRGHTFPAAKMLIWARHDSSPQQPWCLSAYRIAAGQPFPAKIRISGQSETQPRFAC